MSEQKIVIYIAAPEQARIFKKRCEPHSATMKVGTFEGLGRPNFFYNLGRALAGTRTSYTIFDMKSIAEIVSPAEFTDEIRKYVRDGTVKLTSIYIVDADHLYKKEGRDVFAKFGVTVVDAVENIGGPFVALDTEERAKIKVAEQDDELFEGLAETAPKAHFPGGVPSPVAVPNEIKKTVIDPFADLDDASVQGDDDPFNEYETLSAEEAKMTDPFGGGDLFSDFDDEFGGDGFGDDFEDVEPSGDAGVPGFDDDPFDGFDDDDDFEDVYDDVLDEDELFDDLSGQLQNAMYIPDDDFDDAGFSDGRRSRLDSTGAIIVEPGPDGMVSIDDLLLTFSGMLSKEDLDKLVMMKEPEWDYDLARDDIGGGGLFKGSKKKSRKISQVDNSSLVDSVYIAEKNREGGYIQPDQTKIIQVYSPKGGTGKAVAVDEDIIRIADNGKIETVKCADISVGDRVFGSNGSPVEVLGVYPQGKLPAYKVNFADGRSVRCSSDHLWNVIDADGQSSREQVTLSLQDMIDEGGLVNCRTDMGKHRWLVPVVAPMDYPEKELPVDPYIFGLLVSGERVPALTAKFAKGNPELSRYLVLSPKKASEERQKALENAFADEGGYKPGHIPETYQHASKEQRQALLQGILECQGTVCYGQNQFSTTSEKFKDDFVRLARSLGYICSVSERESGYESRWVVDVWNGGPETFRVPVVASIFSREDNSCYKSPEPWEHIGGTDYIAIASIEDLGHDEEMVCFKVSAEDELFVVGDYIVTHNTTVATMIATQLNWYFNRELMQGGVTQNARILILSLNEFDDIAVNDIGYSSVIDRDENGEGRNVAELVRRIKETNGEPEWDDISHCFAASPSNFVFYLPSMTMKESILSDMHITAEDYKQIIEVCSQFFSFIVLDSPDVFYKENEGLMSFAFNVSDVICIVIEPDARSTSHMYDLFEGLKADTGRVPLDPAKCILVVNKYATPGNPYLTYKPERPQLKFERIAEATRAYFAYAIPMPLTEYRSTGNVLFGTDPQIKYSAGELADTILEVIDDNEQERERQMKKRARKSRRR